VDFKTNLAGTYSVYNVAKYNVFNNPEDAGVNIYCHAEGDSIYGNVFNGSQNMGVNIMSLQSHGSHSIFNNTFYNCPKAIAVGIEGSTNGANNARYNIVYSSSAAEQWIMKNTDTLTWTIDSNLYYPPHFEDFRTGGAGAANLTLSQWRSRYGFDTHSSSSTDPGFNDAANGDFTRPSAADEINAIYGGRVWTTLGAVQDSMIQAPPPDTIPPDPVDDLGATIGDEHGSVILAWTAPGGDGSVGQAFRYEILASEDPITQSNWDGVEIVANHPITPAPVGTPQEYTVTGLTPGQQYYIAIMAYDWYGNHSDLSNVPRSYAAGVLMPQATYTDIDSANNRVYVSCPEVNSYYANLTYQFALDDERLFPSPEIIDASPQEAAAGTVAFEILDHETIYYWRCRVLSVDGPDSSQWTGFVAFNLATGLITGGGLAPLADHVKAYPNPWYFDLGVVTFTLPDSPVDLLIQKAASGERVLLETGISGDFEWNGLNAGGHRVSIGVYSWFVSGPGVNSNGKIIVKP
jgi:hypothetical protein